MTIRSTRRSAPAVAISAWSIGCRSITKPSRRSSIICPTPRWRSIIRPMRCAPTGWPRSRDFYAARREARRGRGAQTGLSPGAARAALPRRGAMERDPRPPRRRAALALRRAAASGQRSLRCRRAAGLRILGGARRSGAQPLRCRARKAAPSEMQAGRRVLVAAYSAGSAERLGALLTEHGVGTTGAVDALERFLRASGRRPSGSPSWRSSTATASRMSALVTEQDILGDRLARPPRRRANYDQFVAEVVVARAWRSRRPCRARHRPL